VILIRNCPHDNGIYTFYSKKTNNILKSSYTIDGMNRLQNEYEGYKWYLKRSIYNEMLDDLEFTQKNNNYTKLNVPLFSGENINPYKSISANYSYLIKAINCYVDIWTEKNLRKVTIHGDFSLGNIIFTNENSKSPVIIDWEHFKEGLVPWGFDLVNILYDSVYFSFRGRDTLNARNIEAYVEAKKYILKLLNSRFCIDCNIKSLQKIIKDNCSLWGNVVEKLPVMKYSEKQYLFVSTIDKKYNLDIGE
jgi:hypothetical protein